MKNFTQSLLDLWKQLGLNQRVSLMVAALMQIVMPESTSMRIGLAKSLATTSLARVLLPPARQVSLIMRARGAIAAPAADDAHAVAACKPRRRVRTDRRSLSRERQAPERIGTRFAWRF